MPDEHFETENHTLRNRFLTLIAICGELPSTQLSRLDGGERYKREIVYELKKMNLISTFYKDRLRGYRLTSTAKEMLLNDNPSRFSFFVTGSSDTNHIRSEVTRRLRLHRLAETTLTMFNANVEIFRDRKTSIFSPNFAETDIIIPSFYSSREIKENGLSTVKINGSRAMGVLLGDDRIFATYNLGDSLMRWEYKAEMRFKSMMKSMLCDEMFSSIHGLLLSNSMNLAAEILGSSSRQSYFLLDGSYEHFHYLTNDRHGETLLRLLCNPELRTALDEILSDDLQPRNPNLAIENDAIDVNGNPVLFAYTCDLPRLRRFDTAIRLNDKSGTVICFDFQKDALAAVMSKSIVFRTIRFEKFERSFFEQT